MKGTYFLGNGRFETREMKERELLPDEVLVKVEACGVCGTDVHIYHGDKGSAEVHPPVILGHEFSGTVVKTGKDVMNLPLGAHVTVDPNIYCSECRYCRTGRKQLCTHLEAVGVTRDGGFADYAYVPASQCFILNDDVSFLSGAMAEPLACCIHGIDRIGIRSGESVCIIGGGMIGQLMVQLAKLQGASKVILSEIAEKRRSIALETGADAVINPSAENPKEAIEHILGKDSLDAVIECVGNVNATKQAFDIAARGTRILLFSVPKAGSEYNLSLEDVYQKELTIMGSMINPDTHQRAVELINSHRLIIDRLITHIYPHEKLEDAIKMQMSQESIKVVVGSNGSNATI